MWIRLYNGEWNQDVYLSSWISAFSKWSKLFRYFSNICLQLSSFKIMFVLYYFILLSKSFSFNLKTILHWFSYCRKVETAKVLYNIKTSKLKERKKRNDWEDRNMYLFLKIQTFMKFEEIISRADHASGHIRTQCIISFVTTISRSWSRFRFSYALSCIINPKDVAKIYKDTT